MKIMMECLKLAILKIQKKILEQIDKELGLPKVRKI
jgi:hypothetical protein